MLRWTWKWIVRIRSRFQVHLWKYFVDCLIISFSYFPGAVYEQRWLPKCLIIHVRFFRPRLSHPRTHWTDRDSQRGSQVCRSMFDWVERNLNISYSQRKAVQSFASQSRGLFVVVGLQYIAARLLIELTLSQDAQTRKPHSHRHPRYGAECKFALADRILRSCWNFLFF